MGDNRPPASDETARHDHEAGRQLAAVCVVAGLAAAAFVVYADGTLQCAFYTLALLAVGLLAVLWPVGAIRLVSGRFDELDQITRPPPTSAPTGSAPAATASAASSQTPNAATRPPATAVDPPSESILHKTASGIPGSVAVAEDVIKSKRRRAWAGIGAMILGVIVFGASSAFKQALPDVAARIAQVGVAIAFGGLVLWYRTK